MIKLRLANDRGHAQHGWLDSHHTFSFADYYDPKHMGFRALRVINDDVVDAGRGFGTHPHRDMEIITYVLAGGVAHKDSIGTGAVVRPGEVQRMTAGTGVSHSEMNASPSEPLHLLQIWLLPERGGLPPSYEQKAFSDEEKRGTLRLVGSRDGAEGSVVIHQDVRLYAGLFDGEETHEQPIAPGRHGWLHVARGQVDLDGRTLFAGDAAAISEEKSIRLEKGRGAEVLFFDLA